MGSGQRRPPPDIPRQRQPCRRFRLHCFCFHILVRLQHGFWISRVGLWLRGTSQISPRHSRLLTSVWQIFPTAIRARGLSFAASGGAIASIAVSHIWPVGIHRIGSKIYFFFMAVNLVCVPIIWIFYPETKGRSLEDMDALFNKGASRASREDPLDSEARQGLLGLQGEEHDLGMPKHTTKHRRSGSDSSAEESPCIFQTHIDAVN